MIVPLSMVLLRKLILPCPKWGHILWSKITWMQIIMTEHMIFVFLNFKITPKSLKQLQCELLTVEILLPFVNDV